LAIEYFVDQKRLTFDFHSANKKSLNVGDEFEVYYLPNQPKVSFAPKLYNIRIEG